MNGKVSKRPFRLLLVALLLSPSASFMVREAQAPVALAAIKTVSSKASGSQFATSIEMLESFIKHEMAEKDLPAISIALVDDQRIIWAKGFGYSDPGKRIPATADTVYRVGSVSKLFTDIAVMQLVEQGKLDLDVSVTKYLPDFHPRNPFDKPITLRQLMSHRSGLMREPPVGSYFDPTEPTLEKTIASLNQTELVYAPGTRTKYSNAAIAAVGYLVEHSQRQPFTAYLKRMVLEPLGMQRSSFELTPKAKSDLAHGFMWTIDGRTFEAPTFQLGIAPAGSMYSTVNDLGRFLSALFAGGRGANGPILTSATLDQMWKPQYAAAEETGYGIGFRLTELAGHREIGHGGAIYGFSTQVSALPDDKLGVVVVTTKDFSNGVTSRVADIALRAMLAERQGKPVPQPETTTPVDPNLIIRIAGRYTHAEQGVDLIESGGKLSKQSTNGGFQAQLRTLGDALIVDDRFAYGERIVPEGEHIRIGNETLTRIERGKPLPAPERWRGLIGEYGWDHDILYIFEKDGKLWALIEWFEFDPLEQISDDVFKFPSRGLYDGERLIFRRDKDGRATQVTAASVVFKRRHVGPEEGTGQLRIQPLRSVRDLLKKALAAQPPKETGDFRNPDLVELTSIDPSIKLEIRYATLNNFLGSVFYSEARAFMQHPAAEALARAHRKLKAWGYGLLIHDAYRPWYVTKVFWDATPEDKRIFVADPSKGSRHNRGAAVDLTLYDLQTGKPVEMVGTYDETTDRSYPDYPGGTSLQRWHRDLLRKVMESEGFRVYEAEWWHFDYQDWQHYRIENVPFERLK